jgi:thiamine kinase-like enzyme
MKSRAKPSVPINELRAALEQVLSQHSTAPRRIKQLRRRRSVYSSSHTIENLEVELESEMRLRIVFKDLSADSLLATARKVRPHFLCDPRREIETYRKILQPQRLGTPRFYGAIDSPRENRFWLFLERVTGPLLWQMGALETWEEAARWLARLHNRFYGVQNPKKGGRFAHLLRYDEAFFRLWPGRAEEFLRRKPSANCAKERRQFARLADRYDRVVKRLLELPTTFIHGELYPSNVIVHSRKQGWGICPIDWEMAGLAPGLIDLAALTSGDWREDQKRKMVAAYREACEPIRSCSPSLADLMEAVSWCQLHLAVQFLGWAAEWSPPEPQAQNWLREALQLAERLGL